jgi:hypothetical protein
MDPGFRGHWKVNSFSHIQVSLKFIYLKVLKFDKGNTEFSDLIFSVGLI